VLGAPINFSNVTAVTRRFLERLLVYAYWPWQAKTRPHFRIKKSTKRAVTITSSACPAWLARIVIRAPRTALKVMAKCMGAKVETSLYFGAVAQTPEATLGQRIRKKAYKVGVKLASYG
jgi:multimeric flavodoxin WrbA